MFGEEIKRLRIERGLTQAELSKATGIPQNTISWIENNEGVENIQQCVILADYFGIAVDELIGREVKRLKKDN